MIEVVLKNLEAHELPKAQNLVADSLKLVDERGRVAWSATREEGKKQIEGVVTDELGAELGKVSIPFDRRHPAQGQHQRALFSGFGLASNVSVALEGANLVPFFDRAGLEWDEYYTPSDEPRAHIFL